MNPEGAIARTRSGCIRVGAQVHAVGAGDQRHVRPIVDEDARRLTRSSLETALDQPAQVTRFEVRLADLHEIHARGGGLAHLPDQEILRTPSDGTGAGSDPLAVRHEAQDAATARRTRSRATLGSAAHIRAGARARRSCAGRPRPRPAPRDPRRY